MNSVDPVAQTTQQPTQQPAPQPAQPSPPAQQAQQPTQQPATQPAQQTQQPQDQQNNNADIGKLIATIAMAQISDEAKISILQKISDERYDVNAIQQQVNQIAQQEKAKAQQSAGQQAAQVAESLADKMALFSEAYINIGEEWDLIQEAGFWKSAWDKVSTKAKEGKKFVSDAAKNAYNTVNKAADEFGGNLKERSNNKYYYLINQEIRGITRSIAELVADLKTTGVNLDTHPEIKGKIDQIINSQNGLINNKGVQMGNIQKLRYGTGKFLAGAAYNAAAFSLINSVLPGLGTPYIRRAAAGAASSILRDLRTGKFYKQETDKDGNPIPNGKDVLDWKGILRRAGYGAAIGAATVATQQILGLGPSQAPAETTGTGSDVPAGTVDYSKFNSAKADYAADIDADADISMLDPEDANQFIHTGGSEIGINYNENPDLMVTRDTYSALIKYAKGADQDFGDTSELQNVFNQDSFNKLQQYYANGGVKINSKDMYDMIEQNPDTTMDDIIGKLGKQDPNGGYIAEVRKGGEALNQAAGSGKTGSGAAQAIKDRHFNYENKSIEELPEKNFGLSKNIVGQRGDEIRGDLLGRQASAMYQHKVGMHDTYTVTDSGFDNQANYDAGQFVGDLYKTDAPLAQWFVSHPDEYAKLVSYFSVDDPPDIDLEQFSDIVRSTKSVDAAISQFNR